jgi:hypothetical protein
MRRSSLIIGTLIDAATDLGLYRAMAGPPREGNVFVDPVKNFAVACSVSAASALHRWPRIAFGIKRDASWAGPSISSPGSDRWPMDFELPFALK